MTLRIIIAGFGGQGILSLGKIIARAAIKENKFATYIPSYGAEMRGGTANCKVVVSTKDIASPYVNRPDVLIALNQPSWDKFKAKLKRDSLALLNSSLIDSPGRSAAKILAYPFTQIANMVVLGKLWRETKFLKKAVILKTIGEYFSSRPDIVAKNQRAFQLGEEV